MGDSEVRNNFILKILNFSFDFYLEENESFKS